MIEFWLFVWKEDGGKKGRKEVKDREGKGREGRVEGREGRVEGREGKEVKGREGKARR